MVFSHQSRPTGTRTPIPHMPHIKGRPCVRAERSALCDRRRTATGCRCGDDRGKWVVLVVQSRVACPSSGAASVTMGDLGDGRKRGCNSNRPSQRSPMTPRQTPGRLSSALTQMGVHLPCGHNGGRHHFPLPQVRPRCRGSAQIQGSPTAAGSPVQKRAWSRPRSPTTRAVCGSVLLGGGVFGAGARAAPPRSKHRGLATRRAPPTGRRARDGARRRARSSVAVAAIVAHCVGRRVGRAPRLDAALGRSGRDATA